MVENKPMVNPGGSHVWDLNITFSTFSMDVAATSTELMAGSLAYYLEICRDELDFCEVVLVILPVFKLDPCVDCSLVGIACILHFADFIKTDGVVDKRVLSPE